MSKMGALIRTAFNADSSGILGILAIIFVIFIVWTRLKK